jgi:hypothetical protein
MKLQRLKWPIFVAPFKGFRERTRARDKAQVLDQQSNFGWPDGQPDGVTAYFAARSLPIAYHVRGNVSAGDPSAYDKNIATRNEYIQRIGTASVAA